MYIISSGFKFGRTFESKAKIRICIFPFKKDYSLGLVICIPTIQTASYLTYMHPVSIFLSEIQCRLALHSCKEYWNGLGLVQSVSFKQSLRCNIYLQIFMYTHSTYSSITAPKVNFTPMWTNFFVLNCISINIILGSSGLAPYCISINIMVGMPESLLKTNCLWVWPLIA